MNIIKEIKQLLGIDIEGVDIRSEIQDALSNVIHPFKIYEICTGFGKSLCAMKEMNKQKCLVVCSQVVHFQNWIDDAIKWNIDYSKWEFTTYNSLHKYNDHKYEYLILDECQKTSELRTDWIMAINYKKLIALSATIPYEVKKRLFTLGKPKAFKLPIQKAWDWSILPKPNIKVVNCTLDDTIQNLEYIKGKDKKKKTVKITYEQYLTTYKYMKGSKKPNLIIKCTQKQYHQIILDQFDTYNYILKANNYTGVDYIFNLKRNLGARRKEFFSNCKLSVVKKIIDKHKNDRVIVFCNKKDQADTIADYCKVKAIHSGKKNIQKTIDDFNNKVTNKFITVKQADESMNLVDPDVAIIIQLSGIDKSGISVQNDQRTGRSVRSKDPLIYLLIYWNTRDHEYFNEYYRTKNSNLFEFINQNELW